MPELLAHDLASILDRTRSIWKDLRGGRVFITGGTGFIGCWLLESMIRANDLLHLDSQVVVLTRDPAAFARRAPHLANHPSLQLHQGDMRHFDFPDGRFTHVIHAASEKDPRLYMEHPLRMLDLTLSGTRRVLDFALQCGNPKFLLVSSSDVYGQPAAGQMRIHENNLSALDARDLGSTYGEGKRLSELLCMTYGRHYGLQIKIGRCFPAIGPYMSLEAGGVAGRFIQEGLEGGPIRVNGSGDALCSYMYAADVAAWLWTILVRGECGCVYNVGSEQAVTVAELAQYIGRVFRPPIEVRFEAREVQESDSSVGDQHAAEGMPSHNNALTNRSILPSTQAAQANLRLRQEFSLQDAIYKTVEWHRSRRTHA